MRLFSYFIGVLFILFALVQFNDPDPLLWIVIYLIPATFAFAFTHKKINRNLLAAFGILYLMGAIYLFPMHISEWIVAEEKSKSLNMTLPGIEEARESMGLFICFCAILFFWIKRTNRA
jgi:hypothetical protein